jgi:replicative DNA helicase
MGKRDLDATVRTPEDLARGLDLADNGPDLNAPEEPAPTVDLDKEAPTVGTLAEEAFDRMLRRANGDERPIPLPWPTVADALGGGLWSGLHVVVGSTGAGKSQFSLQMALHAAQQGIPVLYCGLELGRVDLVARLLGLLDQRKWSNLWLGQGRENENPAEAIVRLQDLYGPTLATLPFHLAFAKPYGWPYSLLQPYADALRHRYRDRLLDGQGKPVRPFMVVLDFLQLVSSSAENHEELRERIQKAAYAGRAIARDMDAAVVLVSGTARENYRELDGRPPKGEKEGSGQKLGEGNPARFVGLGKESGEIEFASDSVVVLCREPWKEKEPDDGTHIWLALAKTRARGDSALAQKGWVELRFNGGWFSEPRKSRDVSL